MKIMKCRNAFSSFVKSSSGRAALIFVTGVMAVLSQQLEVSAVPAAPIVQTVTQPDGTQFQARLRGDEWFHWKETVDGHPVVLEPNSRYWVYALPVENALLGNTRPGTALPEASDGATLSASDRIVGKQAAPIAPWRPAPPATAIQKREFAERRDSRNRRTSAAEPSSLDRQNVPATGTAKVPVILVNFTDRTTTFNASNFNTLLFDPGSKSMSALYSEMSGGQFTVSPGPGGVVGWYTATRGHDYYGANDAAGNDPHVAQLVKEAVAAAEQAGFDFSPYDQDGDGYVDVVNIIHQGSDEAAGGPATDIWSHQWTLNAAKYYGDGTGEFATNDGVKVDRYVITPETQPNRTISTVGVFCHEYGHVLGLPDLYDMDVSSYGLGNWSLMAYGTYNNVNGAYGDTPAHMDAWCKTRLGWLTPTVVTSDMPGASISFVEGNNSAYKIPIPGVAASQYYLIENRQKVGFDAALPGSGLLIYHVDDAQGDNDNEWYPGRTGGGRYWVALEQADGLFNLERKQNRSDTGDVYPGSFFNRTFDQSSTPSSRPYDGAFTPVAVRNISDSAATMTADIFVQSGSSGGEVLNDNFADAQAVNEPSGTLGGTPVQNMSGARTGTNVGATTEAGEPGHANSGGASAWYSWTAPASGTAIFDTRGSDFNTVLAIYTGNSVNALAQVASNNDISGAESQSRVTFQASAGTTYRIAVDGLNAATGNIILNWTSVNDHLANAHSLSGTSGSTQGTNLGATAEGGEPNHYGGQGGGKAVWYRWTAPSGGTATFDTVGSGFDTVLAVYTGSNVGALTMVAQDDQSGGGGASLVTFNATAGTTYSLAVDGSAGNMGNLTLKWSLGGSTGTAGSPTDMQIRLSTESAFAGDNIYNLDGTNQTRSKTVSAGTTVTYILRVQNDGRSSGSFKITGPSGGDGWTVTYYDASSGGNNITTKVTGTGWTTATLSAGARKDFRVVVKPGSTVPAGSTKDVLVKATATAGGKQDVVKASTTVTGGTGGGTGGGDGTRRPDMQIRLSSESGYSGNNIYNTDGTSQAKSKAVGRGSTATYIVRIQNDGSVTDQFKITGPAGDANWTVQYFDASSGGNNITSQVTGAGWTTASRAAGATKDIRVTVKPGSAATGGRSVLVTATSVGDASKQDTVKATTSVSGSPSPHRDLSATPVATVSASSAIAEAATSLIRLRFSQALDAAVASDAAHYQVQVNGIPVAVESASYHSSTNTVIVALPEGSLQRGDEVMVSWEELLDLEGNVFSGQVGPLSAR